MFRFTVALVALFCIGSVLGNHLNVQLGTFEGSYSSAFGLGTFMCQNDDFVYGMSDESFLFRGNVDGLNVLTGVFYQPGTGPCATGTFELDNTSWGAEGFYICTNGAVHSLSFVKESVFRPTDAQCATLTNNSNLNLEGRYVSDNQLTLDLCFRDPDDDANDDDDETVQGSLQREEDGVIIDQFIEGFWYANGRIFVGTWYENFNAGAVMMYLRDNGNVDFSYWVGLFKNEGETFIDGTHAFDDSRHYTGTWPGPRVTSVASQCVKFEVLEQVVLTNLRADDDDNYYYFVDTIYFEEGDIQYVPFSSSSDGSSLVASMFVVAVAVFAVLF